MSEYRIFIFMLKVFSIQSNFLLQAKTIWITFIKLKALAIAHTYIYGISFLACPHFLELKSVTTALFSFSSVSQTASEVTEVLSHSGRMYWFENHWNDCKPPHQASGWYRCCKVTEDSLEIRAL